MSATDITPDAAHLALAGSFLEKLAGGDFADLVAVLEPDVTLRALLPDGYREWQGSTDVCARFDRWFGDVDSYDVIDTAVGNVGQRLQLRWRVRLAGARLDGERLVEQIAFADAGESGRIGSISLICSGYMLEHSDD